jgi:hypothetical protein
MTYTLISVHDASLDTLQSVQEQVHPMVVQLGGQLIYSSPLIVEEAVRVKGRLAF